MGMPMSDDYLYKTFDVEKPDDYDARKAQLEQEAQEKAERARQLAERLNNPKPTNQEKQRFLDRFKRFFGIAPQDGASGDPLPFL